MWTAYHIVASLDEGLDLLAQHGADARIIAGGTDMLIELDRGTRKPCLLIDVSRIAGADAITRDAQGMIHLGPLTTHNDVLAHPLCREVALPLVLACREVGAPQIRNRATVVGNVVTASPANDTITALFVLNAQIVLQSKARGERRVPIHQFYSGVRKTIMQSDEMVREIVFPALQPNQSGTYIKLGLRRAQAISVVNCAAVIERSTNGIVRDARIALGAVAPTIIRANTVEQALLGQTLSEMMMMDAAKRAQQAVTPISDIRATARYRSEMTQVLVARALQRLASNKAMGEWNGEATLLRAHARPATPVAPSGSIKLSVNGVPFEIADHAAREKTLLRLLREDGELIGTKEGCAEGECGACTVLMDGRAVMSCLVPAPRAHGANIVTVEGLSADDENLHPLQRAFIDHHAVQCGYCTPGFIMSGAALFAENSWPSEGQIKEAISGNLCRCTGYYKILEAFAAARAKM